jgi:threonine synthase
MSAPRYRSTRAAATDGGVSFLAALQGGLAPDGGLYVPTAIPTIAPEWVNARTLGDVAEATLAPFFDPDERDGWVADARAALDFPIPLRHLSDGTYLLELFHGPTRAFKDVAARTLARWWSRALTRQGRRATVLVATSGDTGGAVAAGMAGIAGLDVVVLFPDAGVSPVQRAQLTTPRPGVRAFAVAGSFDDCQRMAKSAFLDPELADLPLTSANSINLGRWLPQAVFHVWGLVQLARAGVDPHRVAVVVPSGNLGNLAAGLLAAAMGAAPGRLIAAHNANDFFPRFLAGAVAGAAAGAHAAATVATLSNAMDVGVPSNFERIEALWGGRWPVPLSGQSIDDDATLARIAATAEAGVWVCPHTAVGLEAAQRDAAVQRAEAYLVHATAHPAKFPEVVAQAVPGAYPTDPLLAGHAALVPILAPTLPALRAALRG